MLVVDSIGAVSAPNADKLGERVPVAVPTPIPPPKQTENHRGSDTSAAGEDGGRSRGRQLAQAGGGVATRDSIREQVEDAQNELNKMMEKVNKRLSFTLHEDTERMMVQVIDNKTNEVVRELPPEEFLDTIAKMREFIGLLFDDWF